MWRSVARAILRYGYVWLALLLALTAFFAWQASKVKLSYEFSRAIPTDNPKYKIYQEFKKKFGEDGNLLVIGIQTKNLFQKEVFQDYTKLVHDLKKSDGVADIISIPSSVNLKRVEETERLKAVPVFSDSIQ